VLRPEPFSFANIFCASGSWRRRVALPLARAPGRCCNVAAKRRPGEDFLRALATILMFGLAAGTGVLGAIGAPWLVLAPALAAGVVLHWLIWKDDIRLEWERRRRRLGIKRLARDLAGLAAIFALGRLLAVLAAA